MNHDYDFGINLSEIEDANGFMSLSEGEYIVRATQISMKDTKNGDGKYLKFEFTVHEGKYQNRKLYQNVIADHINQDAKRIGLQWLKSWLKACKETGAERLTLSLLYRFLHQPCRAKITIEKGSQGYSDKNRIQSFKKLIEPDNDVPF
ncbi:MAG: DUF669 domain-containing protein [Gammaproteobacteria bacterium]